MFSLSLKASDDPETLPSARYNLLISGNKLDKVFIDPANGKKSGFNLGEVSSVAKSTKPEIMEGIKKSLAMIVKSESPCTPNLAIVKVTSGLQSQNR